MDTPSIDHPGWGRLLAAVMSEKAGAAPAAPQGPRADRREQDERLSEARRLVDELSPDVYA